MGLTKQELAIIDQAPAMLLAHYRLEAERLQKRLDAAERLDWNAWRSNLIEELRDLQAAHEGRSDIMSIVLRWTAVTLDD